MLLSGPDVGPRERELLLEAFDSGWIAPLGPMVDRIERDLTTLTGLHAAALSSGTAALHLALLLLGVRSGQEVLTSSLTFAATANAIRYVGAEPVFVDAHPQTWTIDPDLLAQELDDCAARGALPAAVITVDLYGQPCDYTPIREACERHGVPLVQDAAEALGSFYGEAPAGAQGDLTVFSFNGNKIITTGGGGALLSRRADWIDQARSLSTQARDRSVPHYQHTVVGYNYRLSNLLAAVGCGQLEGLSGKVEARRANNAFYRDALAGWEGVSFLEEASYGRSNHWLTCLQIDRGRAGVTPEQVRQHLETRAIESRPVWKPMHLQPVFADHRAVGGDVSARLFRDGLCLPSSSTLTQAERERVVDALRSVPGARF